MAAPLKNPVYFAPAESASSRANLTALESTFASHPADVDPKELTETLRPSKSTFAKGRLTGLQLAIPAQADVIHPHPTHASKGHPSFQALGVRVDAVQIGDVVNQMKDWIREKRGCHSIAATGMNGIVEAQHDPEFKQILNSTDFVVPDGMPLVWLGRRQGYTLARRVYGPDLLLAFCEKTAGSGYRHFFYGAEGEPDVPEQLAEKLRQRFPGTIVAGTYSRPAQSANLGQEDELLSRLSAAAPDVLWVGLGELRQVRWMHEHRDELNVPVIVGVGAAFDMISGRRRQAPRWMREHGFEWLFRLFQEPRRLWRRYLIYGTEFVACIVLESLGLKKFAANTNQEKPQAEVRP